MGPNELVNKAAISISYANSSALVCLISRLTLEQAYRPSRAGSEPRTLSALAEIDLNGFESINLRAARPDIQSSRLIESHFSALDIDARWM